MRAHKHIKACTHTHMHACMHASRHARVQSKDMHVGTFWSSRFFPPLQIRWTRQEMHVHSLRAAYVCSFIWAYVYVRSYEHMYMYVYMSICICSRNARTSVTSCVCMFVYIWAACACSFIWAYVYVRLHEHIYMMMYIYMSIYTWWRCIYTYRHAHMHTCLWSSRRIHIRTHTYMIIHT
jgi:hypothetical protein